MVASTRCYLGSDGIFGQRMGCNNCIIVASCLVGRDPPSLASGAIANDHSA